MNERERLIGLLMQGELEASKQGVFNCSWSKRKAEIIADFLLDNGVIVPPVKVSGTVYINGKPAEVSFIRIENISFFIDSPLIFCRKKYIKIDFSRRLTL